MNDIKQKLDEFRRNKSTEKEKIAGSAFTNRPIAERSPGKTSNIPTAKLAETAPETVPDEPKIEDNRTFADRLQPILIQLIVWFICFGVALKFEFGIVYVIASGFYLLWKSLGKRKANEPSAYSVFNPNCERILGSLTAEQFENEIRHGPAGLAM